RHAIRRNGTDDGCCGEVSGKICSLIQIGLTAGRRRAAAQPERKLIFSENIGQALHLAGIGRSKDHTLALRGELLDLFHHRRNRTMKTRSRLRGKLDQVRIGNLWINQPQSFFSLSYAQKPKMLKAATCEVIN